MVATSGRGKFRVVQREILSLGPYVNADGSNSTAQGKLYMKFEPKSNGTFAFFLRIKTGKG